MRLLIALVLVACLSGCSVFMAASSNKDIDLSSIHAGSSTRHDVDKILGKPIRFDRKSYGDEATYQYFTGDQASYGRAALYVGLDIITFGFAEIVTSPIESLQGDKHTLIITYAPNGVIREARHEVMKAPLQAPEKVVTNQF